MSNYIIVLSLIGMVVFALFSLTVLKIASFAVLTIAVLASLSKDHSKKRFAVYNGSTNEATDK